MRPKSVSRRDFLRSSAAAAAGVLAAAGCQPRTVEKVVKEKETVVVEKEVEKLVTAAPTSVEAVAIDFWWGWTPEVHVNALNAACRRFEELNPDVKVQTAQHEWGPKLLTAIAAGTPPDLTQWGNALELAAREALIDLDPYIAASSAITEDTFLKPSWDLVKWQGKTYGIPGLEHFMVMGQLANVELFEQEGLKVPDDLPVTMDDVMAQVKQYTRRNEAGDITLLWGDISKENWYWWELVLGIHAYTAETAVYNFADPLWVEALRWAGDFYKMLGPDKVEAFHSAYSQWTAVAGNAWATGTQAWQSQSGYWEVGETAKTAPDGDFFWYWNPVWEHRRGITCQELGGHALCIPTAAKHPEEAWRLSEFLVSLEALKIIFDGCGFLTATKEFLDDPGQVVDFYRYPGLRFWVDSPKEADELWSEPRGPIDGFVWDKFPKAIDSVVLGQATPEEAASELQRLVDEEFAAVTGQ